MGPVNDYSLSDPTGIRTQVTGLKTPCPRPLDDRARKSNFLALICDVGPKTDVLKDHSRMNFTTKLCLVANLIPRFLILTIPEPIIVYGIRKLVQ